MSEFFHKMLSLLLIEITQAIVYEIPQLEDFTVHHKQVR